MWMTVLLPLRIDNYDEKADNTDYPDSKYRSKRNSIPSDKN